MNILKLEDLTIEKIIEILDLAEEFKNGKKVQYNKTKTIANLFFEPSTRTHYSFDKAALNLGCNTQNFDANNSSIKKGETLYDTVKTFEMFGSDALVIRHPKDKYYDELVGKINIPILNAGDGTGNHPSQSLLDLLTIRQEFGSFEGLKIAIVGDIRYSRVAHTNIEVMKRFGMKVTLVDIDDYSDKQTKEKELTDIISNVDIVMLLRVQHERHTEVFNISKEEYNKMYGLDIEKVNKMKNTAIIMHPAPFNRGVEIADDVVECSKSRILKQVQNGVFIRMALLHTVLSND